MSDLERRLKESLTEVRDAGRIGVEARRAVAKEELFRRMHRRRAWSLAGWAALVGAAAVGVFLLVTSVSTEPVTGGVDLDPAVIPAPARAVVKVGDRPGHVSVGRLDYVWSSNAGSNDVSRIDSSTNQVVATVDVGSSPGDIAIGSGPVWVALPSQGQVVEIGPDEEAIVGDPIPITGEPLEHMELSVGAGALWVVARGEGLWRVDLDDNIPVPIEGVASPIEVAVKGDTLFVLSSDGLIYRLASATGAPVGEPLEVEATDDGEITLSGGSLWYFSLGGEAVFQLDPSSGDVLNEIDPLGQMIEFVIDADVAWTLSADQGVHYLTAIDRADLTVSEEPIEVEGGPAEAVIAQRSLWMTLSEEDVVMRFSKFP